MAGSDAPEKVIAEAQREIGAFIPDEGVARVSVSSCLQLRMAPRNQAMEKSVTYDVAVACIRDAEADLIPGPGKIEGELENRHASKELMGRIIGIETVDKMMNRQIAGEVRQRFLK